MMLADWYFCVALRLTILQTSEYLDTLEIIRSPFSGASELRAALSWLDRAEPAVQLHALSSILGAAPRLRPDPALIAQTTAAYAELLKGDDPDSKATRILTDLIREALSGPTDDFAQKCLAIAEATSLGTVPEPAGGVVPDPYHDVLQHSAAIVTLNLLNSAARLDPRAVERCVKSPRTSLVEGSITGALGRLPLLLTASLMRLVAPAQSGQEVRAALAEAGTGAGDLEPDLLTALAVTWFGQVDETSVPELDLVETEIASGQLFRLWPAADHTATTERAAARARLGVGAMPDDAVHTVLWQLVLWELAVAIAPENTAKVTRRWWGPPADHRDRAPRQQRLKPVEIPWAGRTPTAGERNHASYWLAGSAKMHWVTKQTTRPEVPISRQAASGADPSSACSPWLDRLNAGHRPPPDRDQKWCHVRAGEGLPLLQLLAVVSSAIPMLRARGRTSPTPSEQDRLINDHLIALVFHCKDVLSDVRFQSVTMSLRGGGQPRSLRMSPGLAALAWHVLRAVDRAGKGVYPELPAAWFAEFLLERAAAPATDRGQQWRRLFTVAALQNTIGWISESSSGARNVDGAPAGGWFAGSTPYARRFLAQAVEQLSAAKTPGDDPALPAAQLLRSHFPQAKLVTEVDTDWMAGLPDLLRTHQQRLETAEKKRQQTGKNQAAKSPLTLDLLLASDYPLSRWVDNGAEAASLATSDAARFALATVRLGALLREMEPSAPLDRPGWVAEWFDLMATINEPRGWGRALRALSLDFFEISPGGLAAQERMRTVLEVVLDNVVEFSANASRYYQILLDQVARETASLRPEGMDRLRVRAVHAIRRQLPVSRVMAERKDPWTSSAHTDNLDLIENLLRGFVITASSRTTAWDDRRPLGRAFIDSWRRALTVPVGGSLTLPVEAGADGPDPREVAVTIQDKFVGTQQFGLIRHAVGRRDDGATASDLLNLDSTERANRLAQWRRDAQPKNVTAVICGFDLSDPDRRTYWVNWGSGTPLEVTEQIVGSPRDLGDLCVLKVVWSAAANSWAADALTPIRAAGHPLPSPNEVRPATVTKDTDGTGILISVDGVAGNALRWRDKATLSLALRCWDPDLSRSFAPPSTGPEDAIEHTLARWEPEIGQWLPVDRSLTELIAGDLPYRSPDGLPAAVLVCVGRGRADHPEEADSWRFSTAPGRSFLLHARDWRLDAAELDSLVSRPGTLVYVALAGLNDPRLVVLPDPPAPPESSRLPWDALSSGTGTDTRNADWLELFSNPESKLWEASLVDGEWLTDVSEAASFPAGKGFPELLPVKGLEEADSGRCLFLPTYWDDYSAHRGEVSGDLLKQDSLAGNLTSPTAKRFEFWWHPPVGDTFFPDRFYGGQSIRGGDVEAHTTDGLVVRVYRDSLPFMPPPPPNRLPAELEVMYVWRSRNDVAATARVPFDNIPGLPVDPTRLGERIRGIVVTVYRNGGVLTGYDVWLHGWEDEPLLVSLPVGCFTTPPQRAGTAFIGRPSAQGWHFSSVSRTIYTRAVHKWTVVDKPPTSPWLFLGPFHHGGEGYGLYAQPRGGELRAVKSHEQGDRPLGTNARAVEALGQSPRWIGVHGQQALIRGDSVEFVGDIPDSYPVPGRIGEVALRVEIDEADNLMSVHRELRTSAVAARRAVVRERNIEETWREQLAAGATVRLEGQLNDRVLVTSGRRLPLLEDDEPFVAGVPYAVKQVSAVLVDLNGTLMASTRLAPPVSVEDFVVAVSGVPRGSWSWRQNLTRHVYYVGTELTETGSARRFEWGHGHTVLVTDDQLTVGKARCDDEQAFPMFHGDRLRSADFLVNEHGTRIINIDPQQDIEIQTAGQVYEEACNSVLHRLAVTVDPAAGTVRIRHVLVRRSRISDQADQSQRQSIAADLDKTSRDRLLALVASQYSSSKGPVDLEVLARFAKKKYLADRGRTRSFEFVESRFASPQNTAGIGEREHIFMVAGAITRPQGNDTYLDFSLPSSVLQDPGAPPLRVRVGRKQFSRREYLLPQLFDEERSEFYQDRAVMLVQVSRYKDSWIGDLTQAPARGPQILRGAIKQAGGSLLAVMSDRGGQLVELRPGVICDLGSAVGSATQRRELGQGALVRISLTAANRLVATLAQRPDSAYVDRHKGRPVVLLPKQPLFGARALEKAHEANMFTVGRLPTISATGGKDGEDGKAILRLPHPRLAALRADGRDNIVDRDQSARIKAATVDSSGPEPVLAPVPPLGYRPDGDPADRLPAEPFVIPWALLSYADADLATLRERCARTWEYHDTKTPDWTAAEPGRPLDIRGLDISREAVFFDYVRDQWTLRYRRQSIESFGAPATALTERRSKVISPAPETTAGATWYTVAQPATRNGRAWGLWIELSPGQVVEIGGPLLIGPGQAPLDSLRWGRFGTGDQVCLEPVKRNLIEPRRLQLLDWRPSPRSALLPQPGAAEESRALLPIVTVNTETGGLRLGAGRYMLDYPVGPAECTAYGEATAVWLDQVNLVTVATEPPRAGDTALLGLSSAGELQLLGLEDHEVALHTAAESWPGMDWLAKSLGSQEAGDTLTALGGSVPVTIEQVTDGVVEISRRLQPTGEWPRSGLVRAEVTGAVDSLLLLRSGGAVHRLPLRDVVRGVDPQYQAAVAAALAAGNHPLWCTFTSPQGGGTRQMRCHLIPESAPAPHPDEFVAVPLAVIESGATAVGLLLRSEHDMSYCWMDSHRASWLSQPNSWQLDKYLVQPGQPLRVRQDEQGRLSAVDVRAVEQQRNSLKLGTTLRAEALGPATPEGSKRQLVVARVSSNDILMELTVRPPEHKDDLPYTVGEPLLAEVAELGSRDNDRAVRTVLNGTRRFPVNLPKRMTTGHPRDAARNQDQLATSQLACWNEGVEAAPAEDRDDNRQLLRAAGTAIGAGHSDHPGVEPILDRWLLRHGETAFNVTGEELELAPALAGCLLLAQRGDADDRLAAQGAVLLAHQIGRRSVASLHVELIARHWLPLGRPNATASSAASARASAVQFRRELDQRYRTTALWFGHGVLARVGEGGPDDGSAPFAWAVLAAVGRLEPHANLLSGAEILNPLAGLARALHPPRGEAIAQRQLTPQQRSVLGELLNRAVSFPISLLPLSSAGRLDANASRLARKVIARSS